MDAMKDGEMEGMQTFDGELEKMIRNGSVQREIALAYATNANNLRLSISDLDGGTARPVPAPVVEVVETEAVPEIEGFER